MYEIINEWNVLQNLSKDFVSNIKLVYIYGTNGKQVIVITNDDNVYAFGDNNSFGCLGLGHNNAVKEPTKIEELCGQQVIQIEFGIQYNYAFALTINGTVFSWGDNINGELGIGNNTSQSKPIIIDIFCDNNVIDIKSVYCRSLALTSCGDVYIWGHLISISPTKMSFVGATKPKIISISTGHTHALALSNNGNVYYWGNNISGQCGNGGNNNEYYLNKWCELLTAADICVTKIACGPQHSMILSTKGIVYCFGNNRFGQCGDGTNVNKNIPTMVNIDAKFIDIAATKHAHRSVGLSDNGCCYIWGKVGQSSRNNPIQTLFIDMNEALQYYSRIKVTIKPLIFTEKYYTNSSIMDRIAKLNKFNKRDFSDIAFKVEEKHIYAQKAYLINVCAHFEAMFSDNNWSESSKSEIEVKHYSYDVYYAFIKYLYTDCVHIRVDKTIELMDLANYYLDETLKQRCVHLIKNSIKNENVFAIYCSAIKYDLNKLKAYCLEFIKADKFKLEDMDNAVKFTEN